jgi:cell division transport system permease protein
MSIYVKHDIGGEAVTSLESDLAKLPGVKSVDYVSPDEGRKNLAQQNSADVDVLNAINEATLNLPGVFNVKVDDINNTSQLDKFVKTNQTYLDNKDPSHEPSFAGKRRQSIQNIGRALSFAEKVGIIVSIIFVIISSLIVFNTIRMAIFSRKEEIQMMKLIGADKAFIRGPFIVEAVVYGFIAAILATGLGIGMLMASQDKLSSYEIAVTPTINWIILYIGFVVAGMILAGALIGVISSLLATRKYLRIE